MKLLLEYQGQFFYGHPTHGAVALAQELRVRQIPVILFDTAYKEPAVGVIRILKIM